MAEIYEKVMFYVSYLTVVSIVFFFGSSAHNIAAHKSGAITLEKFIKNGMKIDMKVHISKFY